jgi:hypothetical protein
MQIGGKCIENLLVNMMLKKTKTLERQFWYLFTWEWAKPISIWNYSNDNQWIIELKVALSKQRLIIQYHH